MISSQKRTADHASKSMSCRYDRRCPDISHLKILSTSTTTPEKIQKLFPSGYLATMIDITVTCVLNLLITDYMKNQENRAVIKTSNSGSFIFHINYKQLNFSVYTVL